jgi:hypothetical protein
LAASAFFGLAYGIVLQRSRFCMARAAYELFLLGSREATKGVIAGLVVATVGFAAIAAIRGAFGLPPAGHLLVIPFGLGTLVGAGLFGLGMSLAGMCAAGTLLRMGEGYAIAWVTLAGMIAAAVFDPFRAFVPPSWQLQFPGVWLGGRIGGLWAGLFVTAVLAALWKMTNRPTAAGPASRGSPAPEVVGGVLLGGLNCLQSALASPWTIAYPLALAASLLSGGPSVTALQQASPLLALDVGLVAGAFLSSALRDGFRLRWPRGRKQVIIALAGGVLMGWGVQLARGCAIGGVFSALPSLSLSAWLYLPGLLMGSWAGVRLISRFA